MTETVIVAVLSLVGTAIGSIVSVLTANRLTNYKIDALQKQVEKHNQVIERTFRLEEHAAVVDVQLDAAEQRIHSLEKKMDGGKNG